MSEASEFERRTRKVFELHHRVQDRDEAVFQRLAGLVDETYFGFEPGTLSEMSVLDAGCGSSGSGSYGLLRCGARHLTALDLGIEWIAPVTQRLAPFEGRFSCVPGSLLDLPFASGVFDFAHCAGVVHHTLEPERSFRELARVVRPGGFAFVSIMGNADGIAYKCINLLRDEYSRNSDFRRSVDRLDAEHLAAAVRWLLSVKQARECEFMPGENEFFASLFDLDLVLTIKDRLQAPTYHRFEFREEQVRGWFESCSFTDLRRLTRYTRDFRNLRRFLAPMYYEYDHPLSRLWFGEGYIQMIGRKQ